MQTYVRATGRSFTPSKRFEAIFASVPELSDALTRTALDPLARDFAPYRNGDPPAPDTVPT